MTTYRATIEQDGDEFVLVFPPEVLDALGAKIGDEVKWVLDSSGTVFIRPVVKGASD